MILNPNRYTVLHRAHCYYAWRRGLLSDDEYGRVKADCLRWSDLAAQENDRAAMKIMREMGW